MKLHPRQCWFTETLAMPLMNWRILQRLAVLSTYSATGLHFRAMTNMWQQKKQHLILDSPLFFCPVSISSHQFLANTVVPSFWLLPILNLVHFSSFLCCVFSPLGFQLNLSLTVQFYKLLQIPFTSAGCVGIPPLCQKTFNLNSLVQTLSV